MHGGKMLSRDPIITQRLMIRPFSKDDAQDLFDYLSDPQIYIYEPGKPINMEKAEVYARDMANNPDFWAVELKSEHKVIGQLHLSQQEPRHLRTWELGYIMNPRYQDQGYGSEAAEALVDYGFEQLSMHRIVAYCNPDNVDSWKLLERIGFRREGLLRKNIYFRYDAEGNPIWWDSYAYARLDEKYEVT
jgi:RimJ/RimL family protein N-acetyltransferase